MFLVPVERVLIGMTDLGRIPPNGDYISEFSAEGRTLTSSCARGVIENEGVAGRDRVDLAALALGFGIDPGTVDFIG